MRRTALIFLACSFPLCAQTVEDSLLTLANKAEGMEKVEFFVRLAKLGNPVEEDKYRAYLNDALAYAESIDLFPGIERVYEVLGDEYRKRSFYDDAVDYSRTGLEIALTYKRRALEEGDDELYRETLYWEGEQLNNMGISRYYAGQYRLASQYFFQALKPRKERPDSMGWANTLNNIGIVHYQLRDYDKAIDYLSQGLPMHNAIGNLDGSARSLNNMGLAYQKLGNYEKAISMHHQAWSRSDSIDYSPGTVNAQQNLAELYGQIGKFDSALAVVEFPRTYYSERKIWYGYAETLMQTGWALANLGNTQAGLDSLNKSLEIGLRIDSYIRVADTYEYLAKTYRLVGDYEKALEYYELGVEARDSIASQAFKQRLAELEIIHDTKEKERELLVTTLEVERQTTLRNSFIIVSILFLALGGVTLFAYRNKQKTNNRLEDRNAFLQSLMDAIPNPTYYKDRDGKYLGCNDAFFEAFGLTRDGVIGKTAYDIFDRESADSNTTDDILAFDSDGGHEYETRVVFADGDPRYVVYYKNVFRDRAGNVQGLIGVVVDVTKMRNAELTLKESERTLREANKAKDKFFLDHRPRPQEPLHGDVQPHRSPPLFLRRIERRGAEENGARDRRIGAAILRPPRQPPALGALENRQAHDHQGAARPPYARRANGRIVAVARRGKRHHAPRRNRTGHVDLRGQPDDLDRLAQPRRQRD